MPLPGVEIVLLDESGSTVPAGAAGEIAFRCEHMSPGYWKSSALAGRLTPVSGTEAGRPFFRTGDLGRLRADGRLLHLGRRDDLIKLRGLRIEPAQIESAILEDPHIRQCAVGVRGSGERTEAARRLGLDNRRIAIRPGRAAAEAGWATARRLGSRRVDPGAGIADHLGRKGRPHRAAGSSMRPRPAAGAGAGSTGCTGTFLDGPVAKTPALSTLSGRPTIFLRWVGIR